MIDWNGNGKHDLFDSFIDYELVNDEFDDDDDNYNDEDNDDDNDEFDDEEY